uniref:Glutathione peroxidase n=1 Tax=Athene cunicularia TaxID=194338 RepID=A0A663MJZ3_ATHCN
MQKPACPTTATLACRSLAAASGIRGRRHNAGAMPPSQGMLRGGWCRCGGKASPLLTDPWLCLHAELNALQNELGPYGLVVLGFPSNQFGKQEPGQNSEILPALKYVRPGGGFVPNFQLFQKGDVNGAKDDALASLLQNACPPVAEEFGNPKNLFWEPLRNHDIKWNFEKFLVGPDGVPVMRWYHRANIAVVKNDIIAYMRQQQQEQDQ